jgi:hypothetical protein
LVPSQLGSLERANLNHWTMDKVQKPINSECYTPSSEPIRTELDPVLYLKKVSLINHTDQMRLSQYYHRSSHKSAFMTISLTSNITFWSADLSVYDNIVIADPTS